VHVVGLREGDLEGHRRLPALCLESALGHRHAGSAVVEHDAFREGLRGTATDACGDSGDDLRAPSSCSVRDSGKGTTQGTAVRRLNGGALTLG
jgi:hypothetical protein